MPLAGLSVALAVVFIGATVPTPLYALYRQAFGFSQITLTLIYSVYVLGNLAALFLVGRISDQIGRRPALLAGLGFALLSALIFLLARDTGMLFAARGLSGFATGIVSGTATAWIAELQPRQDRAAAASLTCAANMAGVALGPLLAGVLARLGPAPLRLSWIVYLILLCAAALPVPFVRETVARRAGKAGDLSVWPRLGVPGRIRLAFLSPAVTAFAIFALIGFYAALIPGLLSRALGQGSPLVSGLIVFELFAVSVLTIALATRMGSRTAMLSALVLLLPSVGLLLAAELARSMPVLAGASALGGIAAGLGYRGSLEVVNEIAPGDRRAEVVSSYLIAVYAGNSLPVIGVGLLAALTGPLAGHAVFAVVVGALGVLALVAGLKYAPAR